MVGSANYGQNSLLFVDGFSIQFGAKFASWTFFTVVVVFCIMDAWKTVTKSTTKRPDAPDDEEESESHHKIHSSGYDVIHDAGFTEGPYVSSVLYHMQGGVHNTSQAVWQDRQHDQEAGDNSIVTQLFPFINSAVIRWSAACYIPMYQQSMYIYYTHHTQIAPEYKGLELGVGDQVLIKAIAEATGRSLANLKEEKKKEGDLGQLALVW